jgi:hypothetical protein
MSGKQWALEAHFLFSKDHPRVRSTLLFFPSFFYHNPTRNISLANSTDKYPTFPTEPPSQSLIPNSRSCVWGVEISYLIYFQQQPTNWVGEIRTLQDGLYENGTVFTRIPWR